jgi:queuine tRNA-ribosyltransferase
MTSLQFDLQATDGAARRGQLRFARGTVETPAFMPVGTYGSVKAMTPRDVRETGAEIILGNTFHLFLRPGLEIVEKFGGLAVGETEEERNHALDFTVPLLPRDKPRYLMGVGRPEDIVEAVRRGVDMFDCVMPTRNARNGFLFTAEGTLRIRNAKFADDTRVIEEGCDCHACANGFSRDALVPGSKAKHRD